MTTLATIATIEGREESLKQAVDSLKHQCSVKIFDGTEVGDAAKFTGHRVWGADYYFTCDDDLIYPPDYVKRMIAKIEQYGRKCVVTAHGKRFDQVPVSTYYYGATAKYQCTGLVERDQVGIDCPGTGVMAWHKDTIHFSAAVFETKNMADIWAGVHCRRRGVPIVCVSHPAGWIKLSDKIDHHNDTIWAWHHDNDAEHAAIINRYWADNTSGVVGFTEATST